MNLGLYDEWKATGSGKDFEYWLCSELNKTRAAFALQPVLDAEVKHCSGEALLSRLVDLYALEPLAVAIVCDKALDRSGALLGKVRDLHIYGKSAPARDKKEE